VPSIPKVFVSAVSSELGTYRTAAVEWLTLCCYHVVHQRAFQQTAGRIDHLLTGHITDCDAVVCLIGKRYGYEDRKQKPGNARRSYTQSEYWLATEHGIPVFKMLTDEERPPTPDQTDADPESPEQLPVEPFRRNPDRNRRGGRVAPQRRRPDGSVRPGLRRNRPAGRGRLAGVRPPLPPA